MTQPGRDYFGPQAAASARRALDKRLVKAVSAKLGCDVQLVRWITKPTGDVPVFAVPLEFRGGARYLGLLLED